MKLWTVWIICLLMASAGYSLEKEKQKTITVTGELIAVAAIGGETTGVEVELDSPIQVEGKTYDDIEIDPGDKKINGLIDKRVKVTGYLEKRKGVERKEYWVLVVNEIKELSK